MERLEYIEKAQKTISVYKKAIENIDKEIGDLLNGEELQSEVNGMPVFHPEFNAIKKLNFQKADIVNRLFNAENIFKELIEDKQDEI
jgi:hypothetical protein